MPLQVARKGIDFLFNNACKVKELQLPQPAGVEVGFWGGEPFLQWELMQQMVLYAEAKSSETGIPIKFSGTTNGTLLTEEKFDFLDAHKIFFLLSIDGRKESHDKFRRFASGAGSHDLVMRNARAALRRWPFYRARLSLHADNVDTFYEDMKYLFEEGFTYLIFSPVYESNWTDEKWAIFEDQCYKLVDYITASDRKLEVEHFKSYMTPDSSTRACGAGVFYCNIDIDGAIEVCHRYLKNDDTTPWQERPYCIGHIDYGITKPEVKEKFENPDQSACKGCARFYDTICHTGCHAVNTDFMGHPFTPYKHLCKYVETQKKVSEYYKSKLPSSSAGSKSCICYNMCYAENTEQEVKVIDPTTTAQCTCNNTFYSGPLDPNIARPLLPEEIKTYHPLEKHLQVLAVLINDLNVRLMRVEEKVNGKS